MDMKQDLIGNRKNMPKVLIAGFVLMFTPFFFIGIILIIGYIGFYLLNKNGHLKTGIGKTPNTDVSVHTRLKPGREKDAPRKHNSAVEPREKMSYEDQRNYDKYNSIKNSYEQTVTPIYIKKNTSNTCEVCKNVATKPQAYCEICGELFGDGLKCTFCRTKNEMNATHCSNCGVRFKR